MNTETALKLLAAEGKTHSTVEAEILTDADGAPLAVGESEPVTIVAGGLYLTGAEWWALADECLDQLPEEDRANIQEQIGRSMAYTLIDHRAQQEEDTDE